MSQLNCITRINKLSKFLLLLAMVPLISGCTKLTTVRQHKEFTRIFPKYTSVAIIPSYIFINQLTKDGTKLTKPDHARINAVTQMAQKELSAKGYTVTEIISDDDSESNDELNDSYRNSIRKLYSGPKDDIEENALSTNESLGSIAKSSLKKSNADMLLILGYEGSEMSQEQVTKNFAQDVAWAMIGVQTQTHIKDGSAIIGLVERQTGNVLWANRGLDAENYSSSIARVITKNNVMETAFQRALSKLPDKTKMLD